MRSFFAFLFVGTAGFAETGVVQGVVTPIGAILKAANWGHDEVTRPRRFFLVGHRVTKVFKTAQNDHRVKSKPLQA